MVWIYRPGKVRVFNRSYHLRFPKFQSLFLLNRVSWALLCSRCITGIKREHKCRLWRCLLPASIRQCSQKAELLAGTSSSLLSKKKWKCGDVPSSLR